MRIYRNLFQFGLILTISSIYSVQNQSPTTEKTVKKTSTKPTTSFQIGNFAKNFHSWAMVKMAKKINPWAALQTFANLGFCVAVLVLAIKLNESNKALVNLEDNLKNKVSEFERVYPPLARKVEEIDDYQGKTEVYKGKVEEAIETLHSELNELKHLKGPMNPTNSELSDSIDRISTQITINSDERAKLIRCVCLITNALQSLELLNLELLRSDTGKTQVRSDKDEIQDFSDFIEDIAAIITKELGGFSYAPRRSTAPRRSGTSPIAPQEPPSSSAIARLFGGGSRPSTPTAPPTPRQSAQTTPRPGTPRTATTPR